jgi:hypothetical protein
VLQGVTENLLMSREVRSTLVYVSCQVNAKFGYCTIVDKNGTLVEAKMYALYL